ncbi:hypothetical protein SAV31267_066050 [Streptomyces avermitilis]|uniref:Cytochrome P450 n=1 Tax=Streptomyces avermitilis TaxID=33903 RepID=A0A4D4MY52_STRAX|nr:hypothetical protein SAV31267_066050 [Streptomyces avermitilis]
MEVGGQTIRAGEGVLCTLSTANRDEGAFTDPDELDLRRDARSHLSFGFGIHQCIGQSLARAEPQIALETLLRRLPGCDWRPPSRSCGSGTGSGSTGSRSCRTPVPHCRRTGPKGSGSG